AFNMTFRNHPVMGGCLRAHEEHLGHCACAPIDDAAGMSPLRVWLIGEHRHDVNRAYSSECDSASGSELIQAVSSLIARRYLQEKSRPGVGQLLIDMGGRPI